MTITIKILHVLSELSHFDLTASELADRVLNPELATKPVKTMETALEGFLEIGLVEKLGKLQEKVDGKYPDLWALSDKGEKLLQEHIANLITRVASPHMRKVLPTNIYEWLKRSST